MGIYDFKNIENAPVKVTVYLPRRLYEEAEEASLILGQGGVRPLIIHLLENVVEELKAAGYKLKPFWEEAYER